MSWDYRVLVFEQPNSDLNFAVCEVYYDEAGNPTGYTDPIDISGETIEELRTALNYIRRDISKPVLWGGSKFPNQFNVMCHHSVNISASFSDDEK